MTTKYALVNFVFDSQKLSNLLTTMDEETLETARLTMDLSTGAIWHWKNNRYPSGVNYPHMTNFIALCNLLDLDPREFFVLDA